MARLRYLISKKVYFFIAITFSTPGKCVYGMVSLVINWVPGVPAFVTYISMYRTKFRWYSVILYALGVLVLYPLFPLWCFINLLYKKPKSKNDPISDDFIEVIFRLCKGRYIG